MAVFRGIASFNWHYLAGEINLFIIQFHFCLPLSVFTLTGTIAQ